MDRDRILLTPGPSDHHLRTKLAMLRDWGSWDADFNALTASLRRACSTSCTATEPRVVPLQGSGTFGVEAAVATLVPRDGHVLVLDNGAYCKRAAKLTQMMGRKAPCCRSPRTRRSRRTLDELREDDPSSRMWC